MKLMLLIGLGDLFIQIQEVLRQDHQLDLITFILKCSKDCHFDIKQNSCDENYEIKSEIKSFTILNCIIKRFEWNKLSEFKMKMKSFDYLDRDKAKSFQWSSKKIMPS